MTAAQGPRQAPEDTQLSPRSRTKALWPAAALAAPPREWPGWRPSPLGTSSWRGSPGGTITAQRRQGGSGEFEDGPQGWKQHLRSPCDLGAQTACGWVFSWRLLPQAPPVGSMPTVLPEP